MNGNFAPVIEAPAETQVLSDQETTLTIRASDADARLHDPRPQRKGNAP